jgi:hypothetical protein
MNTSATTGSSWRILRSKSSIAMSLVQAAIEQAVKKREQVTTERPKNFVSLIAIKEQRLPMRESEVGESKSFLWLRGPDTYRMHNF